MCICEDNNVTAMVTHDVDKVVLLSDRLVMMTNGSTATIGEVMDIPFERPSCWRSHLGRVSLAKRRRSGVLQLT